MGAERKRKDKKEFIQRMQQLVYKTIFIVAALLCGTHVSAQTEVNFHMEIDTTLHGIHVGQEFELKYRYIGVFDSVPPPQF